MAKKQGYLKKKQSFSGAQVLLFVLAFAAVGAVAIWQSLAAPHSKSGSYSVTLSPDSPYSFGQQVYINTDVPVSLKPYVWLKCYQNGTLVLSGDHAAFPDGWYYNWPFTLGPTQTWTTGAADCNVSVVHVSRNKTITDARTSFHVEG